MAELWETPLHSGPDPLPPTAQPVPPELRSAAVALSRPGPAMLVSAAAMAEWWQAKQADFAREFSAAAISPDQSTRGPELAAEAPADPAQSDSSSSRSAPSSSGESLQIVGDFLLHDDEIAAIKASCATEPEELLPCVSARLTSEIISRGYTTSRVLVQSAEPPRLLVKAGKIADVRIQSPRGGERGLLEGLKRELVGRTFHYPTLSALIRELKAQWPDSSFYVDTRTADPEALTTVIEILIDRKPARWHGGLSLSNDGGGLTGEFRANATLSKEGLIREGDKAFFFIESNSDSQFELGLLNAFLYYQTPLFREVDVFAAVGAASQQWVEYPRRDPYHDTTFQQTYYSFGLRSSLRKGSALALDLDVAIARNGNAAFSPVGHEHVLPGVSNHLNSGYLSLGLALRGIRDRLDWKAVVAFRQGLSAMSEARQRRQLELYAIRPAEAQAIFIDLQLDFRFNPNLWISSSFHGQYAFDRLLPSMEFEIGADTGILGVPAIAAASDNGILSLNKINFKLFEWGKKSLLLSPYLGYGLVVSAPNPFGSVREAILSTGLLLTLSSPSWIVETGWVVNPVGRAHAERSQLSFLGQGAYLKLGYRF